MKEISLSRSNVISMLDEIIQDYHLEYTEIYISIKQYHVSTIKDAVGNKIFTCDEQQGWLIFIDPYTMKNWGHRCEYLLVTDTGIIIENKEASYRPYKAIDLEQILIEEVR